MNFNRHTSGILVVALLAALGYLLVSLPPTIIEQYKNAAEISPLWGYVYLTAVLLGTLLLLGITLSMVLRVLVNSRRKAKQQRRRGKDPSELSSQEQEAELQENLASGDDFASGDEVPPEVRAEIKSQIAGLQEKLDVQTLEIVAFGTISSGKSSLLNTLAGREVFRTNVVGGTTITRNEIPWPGSDRVVLVDTPGLAEVQGEGRATEAAGAAKDADLVLLVVDGPLKAYEVDLLRQLAAMEKRVLICLNKEDWFEPEDRKQLLGQIEKQAAGLVPRDDLFAVQASSASRMRMRVMPDGREAAEEVESHADISQLAARMLKIIETDRRGLLLANLLLQSRGLVEQAKERVRQSLDHSADEVIGKYMWAAGGVAAVNPVPLLDLIGGSAVTIKMVLELARIYRQDIDSDTIVTLLGNLTKNLIGMLGVTAATPIVTATVASLIKSVPGVGTIAGGMMQGLVQALITRWIGKVFKAYFQAEMKVSRPGLAEIARTKWQEVTQPGEIVKLIQTGRKKLGSPLKTEQHQSEEPS